MGISYKAFLPFSIVPSSDYVLTRVFRVLLSIPTHVIQKLLEGKYYYHTSFAEKDTET